MENGENDAPIPGVDASQREMACLKLAELPEALAIVQAARRRPPRLKPSFLWFSRRKLDQYLDDNVYLAVFIAHHDDRPAQVVGNLDIGSSPGDVDDFGEKLCMVPWS